MGDAGRLLAGRFGQVIGEGGMILVLVFIMAAHLTAFTIMMNVLTDHPTCSVLLSLVGLTISFLLSMPRKLEKVAWMSVICENLQHWYILGTTCTNNNSLYLCRVRSLDNFD
jgi:hypothetical protein